LGLLYEALWGNAVKRIERLLKKARANARRFAQDKRGNIAIFFALALIPVLGGAAGAIDFSRAYIVRERLTSALDAAGLAVGSMTALPQEEFQAKAQSYFDANYPDDALGTPGPVAVTEQDGQITLSATASMPTALLKIMGISELDIGATVTIARESSGIELVMVLDNTGSMAGSRLSALKTAASDLIDILFGEDKRPDFAYVGLVPFAAAVNVGADKINEPWMDKSRLSSIHGENFEGNTNIFDLYDKIKNRSWNGCVETRPEPYDENDAVPVNAIGDTLWVPWFAPDEPDGSGWSSSYSNDYLDDGWSCGSDAACQRKTAKYNNANVGSWSNGPQKGCNVRTITPLTNDKNLLLDEIDDMMADGMTHIPLGLAWGWRVISPSAPYTEGTAYDDKDYKKVIILLTDGENTIPEAGGWFGSNHNKSEYTAYGYLAEKRLGTDHHGTAVKRLDEKTLRICDNVKEAGIRLYTITFQVNDNGTKEMMRKCATSANMYFNSPSSSELKEVFKTIAQELNALRIAK